MFDRVGLERSIIDCEKGEQVFSQGGPCDAIFYVLSGQIKLTVLSEDTDEYNLDRKRTVLSIIMSLASATRM